MLRLLNFYAKSLFIEEEIGSTKLFNIIHANILGIFQTFYTGKCLPI